jgi:hypothetical protein
MFHQVVRVIFNVENTWELITFTIHISRFVHLIRFADAPDMTGA